MSEDHLQKTESIRISYEEANSQHVDDLLKRQLSLRGESVSRQMRGRWYYRNWFLFMIAGLLASIGAWAIIEPYFDDMLYIQGTVQSMGIAADMPEAQGGQNNPIQEALRAKAQGWIKVNGQTVWIMEQTGAWGASGHNEKLDLSQISVGQQVGLYVDMDSVAALDMPMAQYVAPSPAVPPPAKATLTLKGLVEQTRAAGLMFFSVVAAIVGLAIGAVDGLICRVVRRMLLAGAVGLLVGFIGGFISNIIANLVYAPLTEMAMKQSGDAAAGLTTFGFLTQVTGRGLAWCLAGMAMGLGQGIALRSGRLLLYGLLGGIIGGLLGGLLFDPIDMLILGGDHVSGHWSRLAGLAVIGACVGLMIGIVELLARDAWLQMVEGPLAGKEFLIFKDTMHVGASPKCEIYLFNDNQVAPQHAVLRSVGDNYEIENLCRETPMCLNARPTQRARLHNGDQITIGRTVFVFQKRKR